MISPIRFLHLSCPAVCKRISSIMFDITTRVTACKCGVNCSVNCTLSSIWKRCKTTEDYILLQVTTQCTEMTCWFLNILWLNNHVLFASEHWKAFPSGLLGFLCLKWSVLETLTLGLSKRLLHGKCQGSRLCFSLAFSHLENFTQQQRPTEVLLYSCDSSN